MMVLRLILFCCVLSGYASLLRKYGGLDKRVTWVASCAFVILVLYVSAFADWMYSASLVLCVIGILTTMFTIVEKVRQKNKLSFKVTLLGVWLVVFFVIFVVTLLRVQMDHYDNYSHWATIVKFLYTEGRLPSVDDPIISYTSYPMGSSLLVYFATYVAGFNDQVMIFGQFILVFACIYAMFAVVRDESRSLVLAMMFTVISLFNHFNMAIRLNNLLVDFLLPLLALAGIAGIFKMRRRLRPMSVYTILIVGTLTLIKSSAIFFAALVILYYLYNAMRLVMSRPNKIKRIFYSFLTVGISFLPIYLWNAYVKISFPVTKHEVSVTSYQEIFSAKDSAIITQITDIFLDTITSLNTLSTQGIILVQCLMVGAYLALRCVFKRRNPLLWQLLLVNVTVTVYYVGIYLMFLFSMPTDEALYLAGFDRYASSMVIFALGLAMMFLARQMDFTFYEQRINLRDYKSYKNIQTKKLYQYSTLFLLFVSTLFLLSETSGMLFNDGNREESVSNQFAAITENQMELTDERYLVVSTNKEEVDNYFVGFFGKYWLYSPNVDGREYFVMEKDEFIDLLAHYDKIMILDNHFSFNAMTMLVSDATFSPGIYDVEEIIGNGQ